MKVITDSRGAPRALQIALPALGSRALEKKETPMVMLDDHARNRLRQLLESTGDSILTVHYKTCESRGNRGVSRTTLYRMFQSGNGIVRTQDRVFHRVVELYRGSMPALEVKQWVLRGDPRGCPLPSFRTRERADGAARKPA